MTFLQTGLAKAAGTTSYQIARSLRFNSADSAYLSRTPASAGNQQKFTISAWVKKSRLGGTEQCIFNARSGANTPRFRIIFNTNDTLQQDSDNFGQLTTTQVFRDSSAWYHIVFAADSTQATDTNRKKLYVNGVQITAFATPTYPAQNASSSVNSTQVHDIGVEQVNAIYFSGYMADVRLIDGQQLDPTSFGEFDANTGVWMPKTYSGTYGTNGFWLKFDDNSNTTAATLGKDSSGNGNNWTPNNFSVTAGVGNDSLVDSPTNYGTDTGAGGEVRGNYATLNPTATQGTVTTSNGNIDVVNAANSLINATTMITSGKWYWEVKLISGADYFVGAQRVNIQNIPTNKFQVAGAAFYYSGNGGKYMNGDGGSAYGSSYTANDVIGIALNLDANTLTFYKNNTSQGAITIVAGDWVPCSVTGGTQCTYEFNFGQRPFAYTAPSGFKALCTQNLPTPAIGATSSTLANKNFDATLYTGTGASLNVVNDGAFAPDFVWTKPRSTATGHTLFDTIRGVTKYLQSNGTGVEGTGATTLTAFNSNGFTVNSDSSTGASGVTYVGWQWKAGGTAVTNTSGSITSTVSANPTAGISVVTYTANGTNGATVGHGLGVAPKMIIVKSRNYGPATNWNVYHQSIGAANTLYLNGTGGTLSNATAFNSTTPGSSVFTLGTNAELNNNTYNYVAYCFAEIAGFSKFGSYTGNGSADGTFVYTGFRPRWVFIKQTSGAGGSWELYDTSRNTYNEANLLLEPNASGAEQTAAGYVLDFLSNGFKLRGTGSGINASAASYIFAAFAEAPFNYSRAR